MDRYPDAMTRRFITASVMAATVMNSLDSTIANVALPHMQGSVAASADQITWVLTSYIIAAAICTPLTGWLAGRFGRKRLMLFSIVGFTIASGLCGIAVNLGELVGFRLLQGIFGAALVPMSQAILLDINPPERHGPAMSIWGMGAILGPIIGPALGGWLTDNYNWRWVFFINLPIGMLAFAGLWFFLSESKATERTKLDLFGFAMLALAIASFQLMLDRGQQLDWFSSLEICVEAVAAAFFLYLFIVHTLTARHPFINLALFADRNFVSASVFGFFLGVLIFAVLALLPPMLEELMGYPVVLTGLVTAPRGMGTMVSMIIVGQLIKRVDPRILIGTGLALAAWSTYKMSGFSLGMDESLVISSGFVQGIGTGLIFVPLSTVAFATLNPRLRNEGAAMFTLIRNIGSAIGISVLQFMTIRNASTVHARLVEGVGPDNPAVARAMPDLDFSSIASLARLNGEITRQAAMVSYIDAFYALFVVTLVVAPLILFMRPPRKGAAAPTMHMD
ncbi:putative multidrug efflux pump membrane protein EmrB [Sphingomonas changbaiensis NBRC 104936]|uniref:Putative multidrug efflux pump membrane protein EmrB n=1 Tax=Sphingomonas changbaiensis NBRC 104936 TaxID=1219043 RepID=A0A0E9MMH9_9SPHN|nr:DHA2 family efflux MFS transporter permease subunit [Sphingomonas changbaiensis]GAO38744.1 putative multidrug efflux pump membrane protein EmrB [Sphingomonas changbaiensis NBRC 104936]